MYSGDLRNFINHIYRTETRIKIINRQTRSIDLSNKVHICKMIIYGFMEVHLQTDNLGCCGRKTRFIGR